MRAVGKGVNGIFAKGQNTGPIEFFETGIAAGEFCAFGRRIGVFTQEEISQGERSFEAVYFGVTADMRFEGFNGIVSPNKRPLNGAAGSESEKIDIALIVEYFVKGNNKFGVRRGVFYGQGKESGVIGAEINDLNIARVKEGARCFRFGVLIEFCFKRLYFI